MSLSREYNKNRPKSLKVVALNPALEDIKTYAKGLEEMVYGRARPHNFELEEAVLGAIITQKSAWIKVNFLKSHHFYNVKHGIIFRAMEALIKDQQPIDLLTLGDKLKKSKKSVSHWSHEYGAMPTGDDALEMVGGLAAVIDITNRVASAANIEYHARIILQHYHARELMNICTEGLVKAAAGGEDIFDLRSRLSKDMMVAPLNSFFDVRSMEEVYRDADNMPAMKSLCGDLLRRGELVFMFAPPGVGKSIFAVQIGRALAHGDDTIDGILFNEEKKPFKVGFVDMELYDNEIAQRYTSKIDQSRVEFSENFRRISPRRDFVMKEGQDLETILRNHLEAIIDTEKIEILIVDNITALTGQSSSDINVATELMRWLSNLRAQKNLTILVLGHTTKYLNKTLPMEQSDMKGAGAIMDFAPTAFGLRECPSMPGSLYIKMVKGRNGKTYDKDNTIVVTPHQANDMFLKMEFDKFSKEEDLLSSFVDAETQDDIVAQAVEMKAANPYIGLREIVKELHLTWSHTTLGTRMKEYCAGSKQYEFQAGGSIIKKAVNPDDFLLDGSEAPKVEQKDVLNNIRKETLPF